jgi:hypothetical protein
MIPVAPPEIMATLFESNMGVSYCPRTENFIERTCNVWAHDMLPFQLFFPDHRVAISFSNP